jgi:hypothetical protein
MSKRTGRPSKYCTAVVQTITDAISDGVPMIHACAVAGVSVEWVSQHRKRYPEFEKKIREAISMAIQSRLAIVKRASESADENTALRAATWWLTHTPGSAEYFSESRRIQVEAVGQLEHSFVIPQQTLNEIAEARARHEQKQLEGSGAA